MKGPERSVVAGVGPGSSRTQCAGTFWGDGNTVHPWTVRWCHDSVLKNLEN